MQPTNAIILGSIPPIATQVYTILRTNSYIDAWDKQYDGMRLLAYTLNPEPNNLVREATEEEWNM